MRWWKQRQELRDPEGGGAAEVLTFQIGILELGDNQIVLFIFARKGFIPTAQNTQNYNPRWAIECMKAPFKCGHHACTAQRQRANRNHCTPGPLVRDLSSSSGSHWGSDNALALPDTCHSGRESSESWAPVWHSPHRPPWLWGAAPGMLSPLPGLVHPQPRRAAQRTWPSPHSFCCIIYSNQQGLFIAPLKGSSCSVPRKVEHWDIKEMFSKEKSILSQTQEVAVPMHLPKIHLSGSALKSEKRVKSSAPVQHLPPTQSPAHPLNTGPPNWNG